MTFPVVGRLNKRRKCIASAAAIAFVAGMWTIPLQAATDTATMSVTATVQSSCAVSGGSLDFGNYQSGQTGNLDAVGTITYTNCSGTIEFELDGGQSGNVNARAMVSGGNSLNYQLYRNTQRTSVFGTGSNSQSEILLEVANGSVEVYGRIPANQSVNAGSYSDTVNITMTF